MLCTLCNVQAKCMPGLQEHHCSEQTSMLVRCLGGYCVDVMMCLLVREAEWMEPNIIPLESRVIHRGRVLTLEAGRLTSCPELIVDDGSLLTGIHGMPGMILSCKAAMVDFAH